MKDDIIYKLKSNTFELEPHKRIDLVIVVNQLLTGFDSEYVNFVYLDKELDYQNLIQAASRTNRVLGGNNEYKKTNGFLRCYQFGSTLNTVFLAKIANC